MVATKKRAFSTWKQQLQLPERNRVTYFQTPVTTKTFNGGCCVCSFRPAVGLSRLIFDRGATVPRPGCETVRLLLLPQVSQAHLAATH
jgi:hypothetical protein